MTSQSNILDVLSGKETIKAEVGVSQESLFYIALTLIVVILVGTLIVKRIN